MTFSLKFSVSLIRSSCGGAWMVCNGLGKALKTEHVGHRASGPAVHLIINTASYRSCLWPVWRLVSARFPPYVKLRRHHISLVHQSRPAILSWLLQGKLWMTRLSPSSLKMYRQSFFRQQDDTGRVINRRATVCWIEFQTSVVDWLWRDEAAQ